tara:strand:- start:869 stop:1258 length:390 start_codon:yes stop_codon:yes gene_type:complete
VITEVKRRGLTLLETLLSSFLVVGVIGAVTIGLSYYFTHSLKVEQRQTANDILAVNDVQLRESYFTRELGQQEFDPIERNDKSYQLSLLLSPYKDYDPETLRQVDLEVSWKGRRDRQKVTRRYLVSQSK